MRRSSPHFTLFGRARAAGSGPATARFGITASRKLGSAVLRNRLRRRTRELLRRSLSPAAFAAGAFDIVINPRPAAATADFARLGAELAEQIGLLQAALARRAPAAAPRA